MSQVAPSPGNVSSAATASATIEKSIQVGKVGKLLLLLAEHPPQTEKIESLRPLVDLVKKIKEKNQEIDAARQTSSPMKTIRDARTQLEQNFLVELQKFV